MRAEDVPGTRLQVAKQLASDLAEASPGDRVGLVVFGGAGFLQLPPTTDFGTFQLFLDAATPDQIGDPATNLAAPLRVALHALEREGSPVTSRAIVLLSDGESSDPFGGPILDSLRAARVPVYAVGVGTAAGARVPADSGSPSGPWHLDDIGREVLSTLNETSLQQIAGASGGLYARWDDGTALSSLEKSLGSLEARTLDEQPATEPTERYQWPLAAAVLLLSLELLLGTPMRRPAPLWIPTVARAAALGLVASLVSCGPGQGELGAGRRLYDDGKYEDAVAAFTRAAARTGDPSVRYDVGNAQYRARRYLEAIRSYQTTQGAPESLREWSFFNLGNAYVRAAEDNDNQTDHLSRAIAAYSEALRLDPSDRDAKWNLEVALRRRGDTDDPGSKGGGRGMAGRGAMNQEGYEPDQETAVGAMAGGGQGGADGESAPELDPDRARRLLETIERQQLSSHDGHPVQHGATGEKDW
jgi:Ca-activated chloride channel family protein